MRCLVIGSGLIGVTTAYFLRTQGHEVAVIDQEQGAGRATSFANGALLTPSMAEPWNAPGCWRVLLASLYRHDSPLQLRLRALPSLGGWGLTFLRNSQVHAFRRNALKNLRLAVRSLEALKALRRQTGIDYCYSDRGTLTIFRDATRLDQAAASLAVSRGYGLVSRRLTAREAVQLEPALKPISGQLAGGLHYPGDEVGDAYLFCEALANHLKTLGVEFVFNRTVGSLEMRHRKVMAAVSEQERFLADRYIVAAGSWSTSLFQQVGVRLPVRPAKGYSITYADDPSDPTIRMPVVDDQLHAAIVPLKGAIRVAGTAEFAGLDRKLNPRRVSNLHRLLNDLLPQAAINQTTAQPWCGLRPMSADGVPIIGTTPIENLLVNTGHGHLGWTLAAGSAQLLAALISGDSSGIDSAAYSLNRFS